MKKIIAVILSVLIVASLCGCGLVINTRPMDNNVPEKSIDGKEVSKFPVNSTDFLDIGIYTEYKYEYDYDYQTTLYEGEHDFVLLGKEDKKKYPELEKTLKKFNADNLNNFEITSAEYTGTAKEMVSYGSGFFGPYSSNTSISVMRADDTVLSLLVNYSDYMGGAHGMYGHSGENFDPKTGKSLSLEDVCSDIERLGEIVYEKLMTEYSDEYFFDVESVIEESVNEKSFAWTINNYGVNIYFQPYEIAAYAAGSFNILVSFDEYGEIFNSKYTKTADTYIMELGLYGTTFDLDKTDGVTDSIDYYLNRGEYDEYTGITFEINDKTFSFEDLYFFEADVYLAHMGDGVDKNYLIVNLVEEEGWDTIWICTIDSSGIEVVDELEGNGFWWDNSGRYCKNSPLDPYSIKLGKRVDCLSTMEAVREYYLDTDSNMLVPKTTDYSLDVSHKLTSLIDLEVTILSEEKKEVIPAGTKFAFLATDDHSYVDFTLPDGRECRVTIDLSSWPYLVNGMDENQCFEGMLYAG